MGIKKISYRFWKKDSIRKLSWIRNNIHSYDKVLDLGCGPCWVTFFLRSEGIDTTPVDIRNNSVVGDIEPIIYNGKRLPFEDDEFDTTLLLTVLHHVSDPAALLQEAKRVSKRIIIVEDIHSNAIQKILVEALDALLNLEFLGHPHSNLRDDQWKEVFHQMDLLLREKQYHSMSGLFKQAVYVLDKRIEHAGEK
ncbi:MAG: class I SAM-dependent methyltransferase [Thermoplasmatota archaeon]